MNWFTYVEPNEQGEDVFVTVSEEDVRRDFYPQWREKMIKKYGQEKFDSTWSFQECLEDWCLVYNAWAVDDVEDETVVDPARAVEDETVVDPARAVEDETVVDPEEKNDVGSTPSDAPFYPSAIDKIEVTVTIYQDGIAHSHAFQMDPKDFHLTDRQETSPIRSVHGDKVVEIEKIGHPQLVITGSYFAVSAKHEHMWS
jgi:hypothetical protein